MNCGDISGLTPLYLSGELDRTRAGAFDAHLKSCPECLEELARQAQVDARLREGVLSEGVDASAVDRRVREQIAAESGAEALPRARKHVPRRRVIAVLGAAAALLLAALGYRLLLGPQLTRVYADAARDHRREIVEQAARQWVVDPVEIGAMAERRGVPGSAVLALAAQGYHLDRARLCLVGRRIFLHLVYSANGQEFSVYVRQRDDETLPGAVWETANGKPIRVSDQGGEHVASVETPRLAVVIVSDRSAEAALQFARFASAAL
jgi:anti-sigma factor RsiW